MREGYLRKLIQTAYFSYSEKVQQFVSLQISSSFTLAEVREVMVNAILLSNISKNSLFTGTIFVLLSEILAHQLRVAAGRMGEGDPTIQVVS